MNRKKNKLQKSNEELDEKIREIYYKSKRRYGAPKICKTLRKTDVKTSLKRVQRRMTVLGIKSVVVKKYKPVKVEKNIKKKENILNQDFTSTSINQKWSAYISGDVKRQDYLEKALEWVSKGNIDNYMSAQEAMEYGLIDKVVEKRS